MPQIDFFISYTAQDVEWARWIAWELERANFTTTYQERDFVPGRAFLQQMRAATRDSRRTIALISEAYFQSEFASLEMNAALAADPSGVDRKLIPIRVGQCAPSELLRDRVYIDLLGVEDTPTLRKILLDGIRAAQLTLRRGAAGTRGPRPPVKRLRARDEAAVARQSSEWQPVYPLRVLFLASEAGSGLDLRGQFRILKRAIATSRQPKAIQMKAVFDVTTSTLFDALNRYAPHVVHFSGKQDAGDILIHTDAGKVTTLSDQEFAGIIRSLDNTIRLVVVDTCYSLRGAASIATAVDFAIGVKSWVYEEDANCYYSTLYQALAAGRSIENASIQASARLTMSGVPKARIPELRYRKGADVSRSLVASNSKARKVARL